MHRGSAAVKRIAGIMLPLSEGSCALHPVMVNFNFVSWSQVNAKGDLPPFLRDPENAATGVQSQHATTAQFAVNQGNTCCAVLLFNFFTTFPTLSVIYIPVRAHVSLACNGTFGTSSCCVVNPLPCGVCIMHACVHTNACIQMACNENIN